MSIYMPSESPTGHRQSSHHPNSPFCYELPSSRSPSSSHETGSRRSSTITLPISPSTSYFSDPRRSSTVALPVLPLRSDTDLSLSTTQTITTSTVTSHAHTAPTTPTTPILSRAASLINRSGRSRASSAAAARVPSLATNLALRSPSTVTLPSPISPRIGPTIPEMPVTLNLHSHGALFTLRGYAYWRQRRNTHTAEHSRCLQGSAIEFVGSDVHRALIKCEKSGHVIFATSPSAQPFSFDEGFLRWKEGVRDSTSAPGTLARDVDPERNRNVPDAQAEGMWRGMLEEVRGWGFVRVVQVRGWELREFGVDGEVCLYREGWRVLKRAEGEVEAEDMETPKIEDEVEQVAGEKEGASF